MNRIEKATNRYMSLDYRSRLIIKLYRDFSQAYMQGNQLRVRATLIAFEKGLKLQEEANKGVRK